MKKATKNILVFLVTFIVISFLALPVWFDLIFAFLIFYIFRKNYFSIIIFNSFLILMILIINFTFGKNEKYGYFYRADEKFRTKKNIYEKNVYEEIFMPHGDLYVLDGGLNKKRNLIKEPRQQIFITDSHGFRNNLSKIEDADIILLGDSFIVGNGTTQEHIPANILSRISNKKIASIAYGRTKPSDYEIMLNKYLDIIKNDAKIYVFYFEGNDFEKKHKKVSQKEINISNKINHIYFKLNETNQRIERAKDKFLLKSLSEKNYFLRNIRAKSHTINRIIFSKLYKDVSPVKYFKIGKKVTGFYYYESTPEDNDYFTYIFKDKKVLNRINGIFYLPAKFNVYSNYLNLEIKNNKFKFLNDSYLELNIPVYDLSKIMKLEAKKYLKKDKYLYWRDDTHWNQHGIFVAMSYINKIIKK